jgi:predicted RNase H-like HicB family nuclease
MRNYIALIHKDAESDYGVSFPDFPGVVTAGLTLDEAREMAEEALAFHVEGLIEDGNAVPEALTLEGVMADPTNRDGVAVLVTWKGPAARVVRINVTLPDDILSRIDAYAAENGLSRSGFLARAARHEIDRGNAA